MLELAARSSAGAGHEIGCGEAELAVRLSAAGIAMRGSDVSAEAIAEAQRVVASSGEDVALSIKGVEDLDTATDSAELVVCCEVFEHLADPDGALDTLSTLASPWLLASVPREPLWRALNMARGKYLGRWGNTPGHLNHWSRRAFLEFLDRRFEVVEVKSPPPWTMALARVRA